MGKSSSFRDVVSIRLLTTLIAFFTPVAHAVLPLGMLTACDEIKNLTVQFRAQSASSRLCRSPQGGLEKAFYARAGGEDFKACIFEDVPTPILKNFTCMQLPLKQGAAFQCIKGSNLKEIIEFKNEFLVGSEIAKRANQYKIAASKCAVTNGDSSDAIATTTPFEVLSIAKFEFGFISAIGVGKKTNSSVQHGFASVDPSISDNSFNAIEYFSMLLDAPDHVKRPVIRSGKWSIVKDVVLNGENEFNDLMNRKKLPLSVSSVGVDITRPDATNTTMAEKERLLSRLQKRIAGALSNEGFEEISDDELQSTTKKNKKQTVEEVLTNFSYGQREWAREKIGIDFHILFTVNRPPCAKNNQGAIAAYIASYKPAAHVNLDYGNVGVIFAGLGKCSDTSRTSTKNFIFDLKELIIDEVKMQLKTE